MMQTHTRLFFAFALLAVTADAAIERGALRRGSGSNEWPSWEQAAGMVRKFQDTASWTASGAVERAALAVQSAVTVNADLSDTTNQVTNEVVLGHRVLAGDIAKRIASKEHEDQAKEVVTNKEARAKGTRANQVQQNTDEAAEKSAQLTNAVHGIEALEDAEATADALILEANEAEESNVADGFETEIKVDVEDQDNETLAEPVVNQDMEPEVVNAEVELAEAEPAPKLQKKSSKMLRRTTNEGTIADALENNTETTNILKKSKKMAKAKQPKANVSDWMSTASLPKAGVADKKKATSLADEEREVERMFNESQKTAQDEADLQKTTVKRKKDVDAAPTQLKNNLSATAMESTADSKDSMVSQRNGILTREQTQHQITQQKRAIWQTVRHVVAERKGDPSLEYHEPTPHTKAQWDMPEEVQEEGRPKEHQDLDADLDYLHQKLDEQISSHSPKDAAKESSSPPTSKRTRASWDVEAETEPQRPEADQKQADERPTRSHRYAPTLDEDQKQKGDAAIQLKHNGNMPTALKTGLKSAVVALDTAIFRSVDDKSKAKDVTEALGDLLVTNGMHDISGGVPLTKLLGDPALGEQKELYVAKGDKNLTVADTDNDEEIDISALFTK